MKWHAIVGRACALLAAATLSGCASTKVVGEWRDTDLMQAGPYHKVFVVGVTTQEIVRRQFEDAFASALSSWSATAVKSHGLLPEPVQANKESFVQAIRDSGADAALVVRMVKKESEIVVSQDYYGPPSIYGGYRSAWYGHYSPVSVQQYDVITLEARLYDVAAGKLVWAVSTETSDPGKIQKEIEAYAKLISERMGKAGLLVASAP
jgi:hypothetical protein